MAEPYTADATALAHPLSPTGAIVIAQTGQPIDVGDLDELGLEPLFDLDDDQDLCQVRATRSNFWRSVRTDTYAMHCASSELTTVRRSC